MVTHRKGKFFRQLLLIKDDIPILASSVMNLSKKKPPQLALNMITIIWEVRKHSTISLRIYDVLSVWKCILYVKDSLLELEITNVWSIFDAKSNVHLHYFSIW